MCFVGWVAEGHHVHQLLRLLDVEQLGEGGLIDGPHDAAAHAFIPSGQRQVSQRDAESTPWSPGSEVSSTTAAYSVGCSSAFRVPCSGGR